MIALNMTDPPVNVEDSERMRCSVCGCGHHFTIKTEHRFNQVRRLRRCRNCEHQFWTREEQEPERRRTDRV